MTVTSVPEQQRNPGDLLLLAFQKLAIAVVSPPGVLDNGFSGSSLPGASSEDSPESELSSVFRLCAVEASESSFELQALRISSAAIQALRARWLIKSIHSRQVKSAAGLFCGLDNKSMWVAKKIRTPVSAGWNIKKLAERSFFVFHYTSGSRGGSDVGPSTPCRLANSSFQQYRLIHVR
jgi:hypothetical protein